MPSDFDAEITRAITSERSVVHCIWNALCPLQFSGSFPALPYTVT